MNTRIPAAAGAFYPQEAPELKAQVQILLDHIPTVRLPQPKPRIIIVPHAGYEFSGQTAAYAYARLGHFSYQKIILMGPAHFYQIGEAVTANFDDWKTPLGRVAVNKELNKKLRLPVVNAAFTDEHSLEVQLPFLQTIYPKFRFFPILLNDYQEELATNITSLLDHKSLLLVSSDLSHYLPREGAEAKDKATLSVILKKNLALIEKVDACGQAAIATAIRLARRLGLTGKLLYYDTSATASREYRAVVGYAAISFS